MNLPDIEAIVVPFIKSKVGAVQVRTRVPNPRPVEFVRAWVNGGAAVNRVLERVQITVDCWGASSVSASALAGTVRHAFLNDPVHALVRGVEEVTRPYYAPDESSDRYRATYALMVRAGRS